MLNDSKLAVSKRIIIGGFLSGIIIFCWGDHFYHVWTKTLTYYWQPLLDGQSVWVWPIFIIGSIIMMGIAYLFTKDTTPPSTQELIFNFIWVHIIYLSSGLYGNTYPKAFTLAMITLWLIRLVFLKRYRNKILLLSIIIPLISAPLEGLFSYLGLFKYHLQQFFYVPWWLFAAYLHASFFIFSAACLIRNGKASSTS